mmetsp:Transcript_25172/g.95126  ORF Transcript_25172/g.95126 Transcript_25172/m.95126 type:complete len:330 (+) Transcript_25172:774-1763(+)
MWALWTGTGRLVETQAPSAEGRPVARGMVARPAASASASCSALTSGGATVTVLPAAAAAEASAREGRAPLADTMSASGPPTNSTAAGGPPGKTTGSATATHGGWSAENRTEASAPTLTTVRPPGSRHSRWTAPACPSTWPRMRCPKGRAVRRTVSSLSALRMTPGATAMSEMTEPVCASITRLPLAGSEAGAQHTLPVRSPQNTSSVFPLPGTSVRAKARAEMARAGRKPTSFAERTSHTHKRLSSPAEAAMVPQGDTASSEMTVPGVWPSPEQRRASGAGPLVPTTTLLPKAATTVAPSGVATRRMVSAPERSSVPGRAAARRGLGCP